MRDFTFQLILSSHFRHLLSLSTKSLKKKVYARKTIIDIFILFSSYDGNVWINSGIMAIQNSILPKNNMVPVGFYLIFCIYSMCSIQQKVNFQYVEAIMVLKTKNYQNKFQEFWCQSPV